MIDNNVPDVVTRSQDKVKGIHAEGIVILAY